MFCFGPVTNGVCTASARLHILVTTTLQALDQGCATIYLKGPKRTVVIILRAGQFSTKQKQLRLKNFFSINSLVTLKYLIR